MSPVEVRLIEHTHTCRPMEYNRKSCEVVSVARGVQAICGTWRLLRDEEPSFPGNLYIDYCPFCGEWLEADSRTAPAKEEKL